MPKEATLRWRIRKALEEGRAYHPRNSANQSILDEMISESDEREEDVRSDRGAHLYIMECSAAPGLVKIGRSSDPNRRAGELQASQWFWVKVRAAFTDAGHLERAIHCDLRHRRVDDIPGTEWFRISFTEALDAVCRAIDEGGARSSTGACRQPA